MSKIFSTQFKLDAKMIAIIYLCYEYKFPLAFMLSFYEMYGDNSLFALKALSCAKKISLSDNTLIKIIDESRLLYDQIVFNRNKLTEHSDFEPTIDYNKFTLSFGRFIQNYLEQNIENLYEPIVKLRLDSRDLYEELIS